MLRLTRTPPAVQRVPSGPRRRLPRPLCFGPVAHGLSSISFEPPVCGALTCRRGARSFSRTGWRAARMLLLLAWATYRRRRRTPRCAAGSRASAASRRTSWPRSCACRARTRRRPRAKRRTERSSTWGASHGGARGADPGWLRPPSRKACMQSDARASRACGAICGEVSFIHLVGLCCRWYRK